MNELSPTAGPARGASAPQPWPAPPCELDEDLCLEIPEELREAFAVRRDRHQNAIRFYAPAVKHYETDEFANCGGCSFAGVSITGPACALQCDHCQAQVLRPMKPATSPEALWEVAVGQKLRGSDGLLISGGSDKHNVVRLDRHFDTIRRIRDELGLRVLVHVGFADRAYARGLADAGVDSVMLDVIGSDDTVRDVYHLDQASTADHERTLANLSEAGLSLSPHVVIGLHRGEIRGEYRALEMIRRHSLSSLVLVVLQPVRGTPMAQVLPPDPLDIAHVFSAARLMFPETEILLGCERPCGDHKLETDAYAVKTGLNGIAYPAEGIIGLSQALGLKTDMSGMCCSLKFQGV